MYHTLLQVRKVQIISRNVWKKWAYHVYFHYSIPGYPSNIPLIVSDEGYGKNDYIEDLPVLWSLLQHQDLEAEKWLPVFLSSTMNTNVESAAGYAKFETFPIWNIPLKHPVNLAYEAATADLNDVNMIDPFHLEAYGETTVNYNRDVEIFPVVQAMFEKHHGRMPVQISYRHGCQHGR